MRRIPTTLLVVAWALAVAGGFSALLVYGSTPGRAAAAPERWPAQTEIARSVTRPTLLMVVHPHCPCTRASLSELAHVLTEARERPDTWIVLVKPEGTPDGWEQGTNYARARELNGVRIHVDRGGVESRRFGALTSGQTLLYAADGSLVFRGGITAARGHEGINTGRQQLLALLDGERETGEATRVFGCPVDEVEAAGGVASSGEIPRE